jgi:hypothetical protein
MKGKHLVNNVDNVVIMDLELVRCLSQEENSAKCEIICDKGCKM